MQILNGQTLLFGLVNCKGAKKIFKTSFLWVLLWAQSEENPIAR